MSSTTTFLPRPLVPRARVRSRRGSGRLEHFGPAWFTPVMGTGILATALAVLPAAQGSDVAGTAAVTAWALAVALLLTVGATTVLQWWRHPAVARGHLDDPVVAHTYGAPAMALLTVGAGTLLVGEEVLGARTALAADAVLWTAGTALGLATLFVVPWRTRTRHRGTPVTALWLMPVVPPMVSAATGALLVPHAPAGGPRLALLLSCYGLFAVALAASAVVLTALVARILRHGPGPAASTPTLWLVLGPLGQSVTAVGVLATAAQGVVPQPVADDLAALALLYGVPVWGAALVWAGFALVVTLRAARRGMPFTLTWWSFTFPVGTVVTGTTQLALHSGSAVLAAAAAAGWTVLLAAWVLVATRTGLGVHAGRLPSPPA